MGHEDQLALAFDHRPALSDQDFLVAPSNYDAVQWVDSWPNWPAPALIIYGPPGCGKSHLIQVFRQHADACTVDAALLDRDVISLPNAAAAYVIDNADLVKDEAALLHLYNLVAGAGGALLLTAKQPVRQWGLELADLRSRLAAAPSVEIGQPDDALMEAVLAKLFSDRQLRVEASVITYILRRMERSLAVAGSLVAAIDAAALANRRNVTLPLVRDVIAAGSLPASVKSD